MKLQYIIVIDKDEEPLYVSKEKYPGITFIMVVARDREEARQLLDQHEIQ